MKHMLLACIALLLVPLFSGCCSCGSYAEPYGSAPCAANYSGCLPATTSSPVYEEASGNCSKCQADNTFSLPPLDTGVQSYSAQPAYSQPVYGQPIYGQPTYGPEVVGPQFVPEDSQWSPQVSPGVPGSPTPVAPASPYSVNGNNVLLPPAPIPAINTGSTVVPPPAPYAAAQPGASAGPMVPQVPPPPAEPISQMRFRTYR